MTLSVIIPTYNRCEMLKRVLLSYEKQSFKDFEVIVVDDGSSDCTKEMVENLAVNYSLLYYFQQNNGPASARNLGIKKSSGDIILFTGDDIFPAKEDFFQRHINKSDKNTAVLGYTCWHKEIKKTPFIIFLSGYHFCYKKITDKQKVDFGCFYTSNISIVRDIMEKAELFDEEFCYAAYEDTEFSFRLKQIGLKIVYEPEAKAFHNHKTSFLNYCKTMWRKGYSAVILAKKIPELKYKSNIGVSKNFLKRNLKIIILNKYIMKIISFFINFFDILQIPLPKTVYHKVLDFYRIQGIKFAKAKYGK
ncbi:MAG: glycosyltransferase [Patescibacteria group bacterium]